ncbi:hypothetical protein [Spongiactinospora sp. TRM90649]|uniref:hypothetical protein n=1 Tax=Spongiactinospora sp. TRM90649 TaxID=3031114 RepID=UPI0023F6A040|nr:hypothetical protein [Spongiactinospora sp. TRM90649]MDF5751841.1 hypothetical protein [Spongiactinospora sp. TRM90649]
MAEVYVTAKGDKYHKTENCWGLIAGQKSGEGRYDLQPIEPKELGDAIANGWTACGTCGGS